MDKIAAEDGRNKFYAVIGANFGKVSIFQKESHSLDGWHRRR